MVIVLSKAHAFLEMLIALIYKWIFLVLLGLRIVLRITRLRDRDRVSLLEAFIFFMTASIRKDANWSSLSPKRQ